MKVTLSQRFIFEAAHTLQRDEGSLRVHGHTYHAEISFSGEPNPETGMLTDLSDLRNITEGIRDALDHRMLDEVAGLGPATIENLCHFIARRLNRYPEFEAVRVWRADGGACTLTVAAEGSE